MKLKYLVFLITSILFGACSSQMPDVSQAKSYSVIDSSDESFPGRKRIEFVILAPEASTFEQFAHTAIKAAINKERETKYDVIYIRLEPTPNLQGTGDAYALAFYAPDGGGHSGDQDWEWQVTARSQPYTTQQIQISELWWENRDRFQKDGCTDEPAIREFISNKLNIPVDEVHLPSIYRGPYRVK